MRIYAFFVALFLALSFGASGAQAVEPQGHSYCIGGIASKEQLLAKMDASLAADLTGNKKLQGCVATPNDFLTIWKKSDAKANLASVADLHRYISEFTATQPEKDTMYQSACLRDRVGGTHEVVADCTQRDPKPGEVIYASRTGMLVLMGGCANPGVGKVPPTVVEAHCLEIDTPSMKGVDVRFAHTNDHLLSGYCMKMQLAGEQAPRHDLPEECSDAYTKEVAGRLVKVICSWDKVEEDASRILNRRVRVGNVSGSYKPRANGVTKLYLSADAIDGETWFCFELPDGRFVTKGVRREQFVRGVAVITREQVLAEQ